MPRFQVRVEWAEDRGMEPRFRSAVVRVRAPSAVEAGIRAEQRISRLASFRSADSVFHRGEALDVTSTRPLAARLSRDTGWQTMEEL